MAIDPTYPIKPAVDTNLLAGGGPDPVNAGSTYTDPNFAVPNDQAQPVVDISLLPGVPGQRGPAGAAGATGKAFQILGTYASYSALTTAHPIGAEGDFYRVVDNLYGWNVFLNSWQDLGVFTGPSGIVNVTSPITNSGTTTSAVIGINQSALQIAESQVTNLVSDLAAKETPSGAQSKASAALASANSYTDGVAALKAPIANPTFTGTVSGITKAMVGLSNVDNTTDANKPVSTATQTALDLKSPLASPTFTGTVSGITKSMVGLGNVDNTSDANKPVSSATQTALNLKLDSSAASSTYAPLASPTFTGTVSGITKAMVGLSNVDNTTDANKPISSATQTALDAKAPLASPALTGTPTAPTATSGTNTTQVATTEFVGTAVSNLVAAAPAALDTLNELATALGNDASFATTVTNSLAAKAALASANAFTVGGHTITNASAGVIPLRINGASGQTADIFTIYNNAGTLTYRATEGSTAQTGHLTVGSSTLTSLSAMLNVNNTVASRIGAVIRGAASQTAPLTEWQNTAGTVLAKIDSAGTLSLNPSGQGVLILGDASITKQAGSAFYFNSGGNFSQALAGVSASFTSAAAATNVLIAKGTTSQTGDLQQWQDVNSTVLAKIDSSGSFTTTQSATVSGVLGVGTPADASYQLSVLSGANNRVPLRIRPASAQTVDLTQWQNNSGGAILASVTLNGTFWGKSFVASGYRTTNTAGAYVGQWTKIGAFTMTTQYANVVALIDFSSDGPGLTNIANGRLFVSTKQQQPMGTPPEPPTMTLLNASDITINDFALVLAQNDATTTRYDLYVRNNQYYQIIYFTPTILSGIAPTFFDTQPYITNLPDGMQLTASNFSENEVTPIDNLSNYFNGVTNRFQVTSNGVATNVKNPFRLMVSVNGVVQTANTPEYAWQSPIPYDGFFLDNDGFINFSDIPVPGYTFDGRILAGAATSTKTKNYPFRAVDLLVGA